MAKKSTVSAPLLQLLQVLLLLSAPIASYGNYMDPNAPLEKRVTDLLSRMTLVEKIGQMTQVEIGFLQDNAVKTNFIGSLLKGGGDMIFPEGRTPQDAWADKIDAYQRQALSTRLKIPIMFGIDAVHGNNAIVGATIYPHNIGLGATRNPALVRRIAAKVAVDVRGAGAHWNFAPCIAVCRDPRWGRCYESFGESTVLVRRMTSSIFGYQGWNGANATLGAPTKCAATAKHFAGDGGTTGGVDQGNTQLSWAEFDRIHLSPYRAAVRKGVSSIMISYSSFNGMKMHAARSLISGWLKGRLGFKGFCVSDWAAANQINPSASYAQNIKVAINAGIDMIMVPDKYVEFQNTLLALVRSGQVRRARINAAVRRILRVKFQLGLFERPFTNRQVTAQFSSPASKALARAAVRQSLVLLKNERGSFGPTLPLAKNAKSILVVGAHANDVSLQCGGWTLGWQAAQRSVPGTTVLEAVKSAVSPSTRVQYSQTYSPSLGTFTYGIVVVGEQPYAEMMGDDKNLELPWQHRGLIDNVCSFMNCIVIVISGRPLHITKILPQVDALVAAWLPGSEAAGITDVLFGDYPFTGKLPITWFKDVQQLPTHFGDPHYAPLFPYGYGL